MFKKMTENFTCEHCDREVVGNGYTNHCPACLWSKHVDIDPGDRAAACGGLMEPVLLEEKSGQHDIVHRCIVCGHKKRNKVQKEDAADVVVALSSKPS